MNRDEKRSRVKGLPPAIHQRHGHCMLYPSEPTGGTWIGLNDQGISFALINWYSIAARVVSGAMSRGTVIPSIGAADSTAMTDKLLSELPLDCMNPFRMVAVFPDSPGITEWRWDLKRLTREHHGWRPRQWASSGFDESKARAVRNRIFTQAQAERTSGTIGWLRRLHCSHEPNRSAFSTCMHRDDAATVSYTEVDVSTRVAKMLHLSGPPCAIISNR